jgi:hypothetical protein
VYGLSLFLKGGLCLELGKGKITNISKKIFTLGLTFALATVGLTGCADVSIDDIKYVTDEQESIQSIKNSVSYETLQYCSFYNVYNNKKDKRYYTIGLKDEWNGTYLIKYYDIFTKEEFVRSDFAFHSIATVQEYLVENNLVKAEYTEEELQSILNQFVEEYENKNEKKLVKE